MSLLDGVTRVKSLSYLGKLVSIFVVCGSKLPRPLIIKDLIVGVVYAEKGLHLAVDKCRSKTFSMGF